VWLANVTVIDPRTGRADPGRSVQVEPTGIVLDGPPDAPADEVFDVHGRSLTLGVIPPGVVAVADALQAAIVAGDLETVERLYADDIVIWHNYDRVEQGKTHGLATISAIQQDFEDFRAVDVRRDYLPDGYVQRTVFEGSTRTSEPFSADAMMRVWTDGRTITRIEEYSTGVSRPSP
jgi:ketosteroid isomerase-like protein